MPTGMTTDAEPSIKTTFNPLKKKYSEKALRCGFKTWPEYFEVYTTIELVQLQKQLSKELLRRLSTEEDR